LLLVSHLARLIAGYCWGGVDMKLRFGLDWCHSALGGLAVFV
jgi:hypothetical protein